MRHRLIGIVERGFAEWMIVPFDTGDLTGFAADAGSHVDVLADIFFAARALTRYRSRMGRDFLNLKCSWITHLMPPLGMRG